MQHRPSLPYAEMPAFMVALSNAPDVAATMLRYVIFTACRTNEVADYAF